MASPCKVKLHNRIDIASKNKTKQNKLDTSKHAPKYNKMDLESYLTTRLDFNSFRNSVYFVFNECHQIGSVTRIDRSENMTLI